MKNRAIRQCPSYGPQRPAYPHALQLLAGRFRYPHRRLFYGEAQFFGDRIELAGWDLRGRHRRCIPLFEIEEMIYHRLENGANLTIHLVGGEALRLHVEEAHRWRDFYENWLRYDVLPSARLLDSIEAAVALAG